MGKEVGQKLTVSFESTHTTRIYLWIAGKSREQAKNKNTEGRSRPKDFGRSTNLTVNQTTSNEHK